MDYSSLKRRIIGEPFPSSMESHERLDKIRGLAIFASDPISSNAYATEAIMSILIVLGSGALALTLPIALMIALLVGIVIFSYIQVIMHYPEGGGGYRVTKDNLGTSPSLLAAGALMTDYILTVSVSVSAGMRALTSAFPALHAYQVTLALVAILLITWINLRGVRESGSIFALPTYAFVVGVLLVVLVGLSKYFGLFGITPMAITAPVIEPQSTFTGFAYTWLLLRAFAAGCTALTGIEAISDGVKAFKPPEATNAAKTMLIMGIIAMALFGGISFLATHLNLVPAETDSILSQMTRAIVGDGFLYYWVQFFTMMILVLAANTGFQDFPRLGYFLARDGFMPRWMMNLGDRLVYSGGIVALALLSSVVVIIFRADEFAMLPLYALGVMVSFTLSQASMVKLMRKVSKLKPGETVQTAATTLHNEKNWLLKMLLSGVGALITFVVLIVLIATKFVDGAWVIVLTIPLLVWMFKSIRMHYDDVAESLRTRNLIGSKLIDVADVVIVPIGDIHRGTLRALQYARRLSGDVRVICVTINEEQKEHVLERWNRFPQLTDHARLICIDYDYRDVLEPVFDFIQNVKENEFPNELITVVVPEFISPTLATQLLHNQSANVLRARLRAQPGVIVIDIPFHINSRMRAREIIEQPEESTPAVEINDDARPEAG